MEALKNYLTKLGFAKQDVEKISSFFFFKHFEKGSFFSTEGSINQHLAFIENGVFQYYFNQDGNEITTYVVGENGFIASLLSVLQLKPAQENIRAITNANTWMIHKNDFDILQQQVPGFKDFYIKILEGQIICIDESRFGLLTQSAEERYQNLLEKEPQLLQQLPLQFLASTLGITQRHLSRIRSKIR
jgi:CRP/FNR family transcriptional regulator, anaerobic regulatory protein